MRYTYNQGWSVSGVLVTFWIVLMSQNFCLWCWYRHRPT